MVSHKPNRFLESLPLNAVGQFGFHPLNAFVRQRLKLFSELDGRKQTLAGSWRTGSGHTLGGNVGRQACPLGAAEKRPSWHYQGEPKEGRWTQQGNTGGAMVVSPHTHLFSPFFTHGVTFVHLLFHLRVSADPTFG